MRRLRVVRTGPQDGIPIWEMLRVEEGLYRLSRKPLAKDCGWLFMNHPHTAQSPTVVLGFSGKPIKLVNETERAKRNVPMLRRFSGGGTVIVDQNTLFVSWLLGTDLVPDLNPYPKPIMKWTGDLYEEVLGRVGVQGFSLRADDYCINDVKFGGNAQAISGAKWLHHTSFLWDYDNDLMNVLTIPEKQPEYRANRKHGDFLLRMKDAWPEKSVGKSSELLGPQEFFDAIEVTAKQLFEERGVLVEEMSFEEAAKIVNSNEIEREVTRWVDPNA